MQCEDFAPDAAEVRRAVIEGKFSTEMGPDGALYTGISEHQVPHWFERIAQIIGKNIIPKISCFRLNLAGENPHSWVHSDDICAKYASVLYLNTPEQCKGGTAFWEHTALQLDRLPSRENLEAMAPGRQYPEWFLGMMQREWKDLTFWKQREFVEMRWNRFVTYPTCLFHSRYPFEAFGNGPEDGRLIWVCFYDVEGE